MQRREFITLLGGAATTWPLGVGAQQAKELVRIGILSPAGQTSTRVFDGLRQGLRELGYVIGETESPIVPIMTGDETRTIALWQRLLSEGLYVNLIVPPGCHQDQCVLRASCSAAHSPEHLTRALDILGRVGAELGERASFSSSSSDGIVGERGARGSAAP